jgi:hypothetical protein
MYTTEIPNKNGVFRSPEGGSEMYDYEKLKSILEIWVQDNQNFSVPAQLEHGLDNPITVGIWENFRLEKNYEKDNEVFDGAIIATFKPFSTLQDNFISLLNPNNQKIIEEVKNDFLKVFNYTLKPSVFFEKNTYALNHIAFVKRPELKWVSRVNLQFNKVVAFSEEPSNTVSKEMNENKNTFKGVHKFSELWEQGAEYVGNTIKSNLQEKIQNNNDLTEIEKKKLITLAQELELDKLRTTIKKIGNKALSIQSEHPKNKDNVKKIEKSLDKDNISNNTIKTESSSKDEVSVDLGNKNVSQKTPVTQQKQNEGQPEKAVKSKPKPKFKIRII